MTNHNMKLNESPFNLIKNGEKEIEYRLNDEKRQKLNIGDTITFSKLPDEDEKITVIVTDLKKFDNLCEMFEATFKQYLFKYYDNPEQVVESITYYSNEEVQKYGCLAIYIKLNN